MSMGVIASHGGGAGGYFEKNQLPPGWTVSGGAARFVGDPDPVAKSINALANVVTGSNGLTYYEFTSTALLLIVRYKVQTEANYDFFRILVNGTQVFQASGVVNTYTEWQYAMSAGTKTIRLQYSKDASGVVGYDGFHISKVVY